MKISKTEEWWILDDANLLKYLLKNVRASLDTSEIEEEILKRMKIGKSKCPVCNKEISGDVAYCSKECGEKANYGKSSLHELIMNDDEL